MKTTYRKPAVTALALAISVALGMTATTTAMAYNSPVHTFSVNDVLGGFDGRTYGDGGVITDKTIICGMPDGNSPPCPAGAVQPKLDKSGIMMYPVDSEFGFHVVDFVGAQPKLRDGDYGEGFAANLPDGSGVAVSDATTDRYKVKAPMGTWCSGMGGNTVKCSSEHYVAMEHVLSCHEVIPYFYADPETGEQGTRETPDGSLFVDCGTTQLDDNLLHMVDGVLTTDRLTDVTPCLSEDPNNDPANCQMLPNDNTSVLNDIAVSTDYSLTLKDDGKPLFRWGAMIKRPNDLRMYARLTLPEEWKEVDAGGNLVNDFVVTKAHLIINHNISNNPNDQIRPEDLENEAAIGVLPDHTIKDEGTADEVWKSTKDCWEGDGSFSPAGTVLKNGPFALDPAATPGTDPADPPYSFSEDLKEALTNGWLTTTDREPFEWSYVVETEDAGVKTVDYRGCPGPVSDPYYAALCTNVPAEPVLFSGPRWRLKPGKFGQDLPGLDIPNSAGNEDPCAKPPFTSANLKYDVGTPTVTVLNLLDWETDLCKAGETEPCKGPLATSKGWVDAYANDFIEHHEDVGDRHVTHLGAPLSEDFDLMVYVKGDGKAVAIYNAQLVIEYVDEAPPPVSEVTDLRLDSDALNVPLKVTGQSGGSRMIDLEVRTCNDGPDVADGFVTLDGESLVQGVDIANFTMPFNGLANGDCTDLTVTWTAPTTGDSISWTATAQPAVGLSDPDLTNNSATASTLVYPKRGNR